jgi:hypothetical protein
MMNVDYIGPELEHTCGIATIAMDDGIFQLPELFRFCSASSKNPELDIVQSFCYLVDMLQSAADGQHIYDKCYFHRNQKYTSLWFRIAALLTVRPSDTSCFSSARFSA